MSLAQAREALLLGSLWGLAVWALNALAFISTRSDLDADLPLLALLVLVWVSRGVLLAACSRVIAERLRGPRAWLALALLLLVLSLSWDGAAAMLSLSESLLGIALPQRPQFLFNLWNLLVYGGPLVVYLQLEGRARAASAHLAQARAARLETHTALEARRLEILRQRIEPTLLMRALEALQESLSAASERTPALLEALVGFLRAAMPGLRSGRSTPGETLAAQAARDRLCALLAPGSGPAPCFPTPTSGGLHDEERGRE